MHKAYLMMVFRFAPQGLRIEYFAVLSDSIETVTRANANQFACIAEAEGSSFDAAHNRVLDRVARWGDKWPRVVDAIRRDGVCRVS